MIDEQINSVRRELNNLSKLGLVKTESYENKLYYSANMKHPFARPMTEIYKKKIGSVEDVEVHRDVWAEYVRPVSNLIDAVLVTNRLVGQDGVDLLIIGNDENRKLTRWAEVVEKREGKPLNYVILSKEDYIYRKSVRDRFLRSVFALQESERYDPDNIL